MATLMTTKDLGQAERLGSPSTRIHDLAGQGPTEFRAGAAELRLHKIERWQKEHAIADRNVYDYESLPRIADNPDIDVVYVVVPTALHAKYAIAAAEAGKHVWCEKPMAMTVEECQRIIDACKAQRVSLSIGYRMQHEPNTRTVMQLARDKPYGAIKSIRAVAGGPTDGDTGWRMQRHMGGGAGEIGLVQPLSLTARKRLRREAVARAEGRDGIHVETALQAQHAQHHGPGRALP